MANEPADIVARSLSDNPVGDDNIKAYINRELQPLVLDMRRILNNFVRRPQIPIFDSSPVTDADFDPNGDRPPLDGVVSVSTADGKLYQRQNGSSTHVAIT